MTTQRRDYILGQIELLGQFVARLFQARDVAGQHQAMQLAHHLQEKLFAMPAVKFLRLELDEQIATLMHGESQATGHEKCLTYAALLKETARLYQLQGRNDLAAGARQLALHVALSVALDHPAAPEAVRSLVDALAAVVDRENLTPPVAELLEAYQRL